MNKNLTKLCYAIGAVMLLFHLNACKDPVITDKGNTLDFQSFNLYHIDTCSVVFSTVPDRPLISSGVSTGVLGSANDLFFGTNYASIYAQCLLISGIPPSFAGCVVDSAVLVMPYLNSTARYGNCNKPIDINVYEVSQDMIPGATYYTNTSFSVYPQLVGQRTNFVPDLVDSVDYIDPFESPVPYIAQGPQIRVRLSNNFANKLLNAPDTTYLASGTFIEYFKGLYVTTNPNKVGDGFVYLALNSSGVNLYYHHASYSPIDTQVYQFSMSTYGVTFNHFDHYYANTLVQGALSHPAPNGDKVGYIQAGGGVRLKMTLPYLKNLPSNIGITKAELIMPIVDTLLSDPSYPPPPSISMVRIDDTLVVDPLPSNTYSSGTGYLSTRIDETGRNYLCYVFNLTAYVQQVLNGYYSNNNGYFVDFSYATRSDRTIIVNDHTNPAKLAKQCKLNITYTKLQ